MQLLNRICEEGSLSPPSLCLCSHAPEWPRLLPWLMAFPSLPWLSGVNQEWLSFQNQTGEQEEETPSSGQALTPLGV